MFFTLTTPDVVDLSEIRNRWRRFRHYLVESVFASGVKYVMNFERHPEGHGWHIHSVFSAYVPLKRILPYVRECGFGRVDVRRVYTTGVAEYLTKHALKAYATANAFLRADGGGVKRMRLVNTSRGLPPLSDYTYLSGYRDGYLLLKRKIEFNLKVDKRNFVGYMAYVKAAYQLGIRTWADFEQFRRSPVHAAKKYLDGYNKLCAARMENLLG